MPKGLEFRVRGTTQAALSMDCTITGAGTLAYSRLDQTEIVQYDLQNTARMIGSTYAGPTTINANVRVAVLGSSTQSTGSLVSSGPLGLGTCNLNSGTIFLHGSESVTVANDMNAVGNNSTIASKADDSILLGQIRTNGYRVILASYTTAQGLNFDNAGWHSDDSGTIRSLQAAS